jgi:hypothetical protein
MVTLDLPLFSLADSAGISKLSVFAQAWEEKDLREGFPQGFTEISKFRSV